MADKLMVVIPCYNEEEVLPETSRRLVEKMAELTRKGLISPESRVLLVDDGSRDRTWELISALHKENPLFEGVKLSRNRGHQNALLAGLMTARGRCDMSISMDADLQDDMDAMDRFIEKYREVCDVVYGVRNRRDTDTAFKRGTALMFYRLMKALGVDVVYNHADYRLMSRKMVDAVLEMSEYNRFSKGIFGWVGFHTEWLEFEHEDRCAGTSKWPLRKLLAYSVDGITGFSVAPLSLASVMGVLFFLISMILIVFIIVRTLLFGDPVAGWPSMACILFLVSGVQLFCTGIVGIYLSKTYLETKHRPIYLLKETSEETVKMHSVQPVKKQESAAKRRKDAHTAEKKNVYFPEYADKRHASERGEIRA